VGGALSVPAPGEVCDGIAKFSVGTRQRKSALVPSGHGAHPRKGDRDYFPAAILARGRPFVQDECCGLQLTQASA
jgi:hypothetical protein